MYFNFRLNNSHRIIIHEVHDIHKSNAIMFESWFRNRLFEKCLERQFHFIVTNEMRLERFHWSMLNASISQNSIISVKLSRTISWSNGTDRIPKIHTGLSHFSECMQSNLHSTHLCRFLAEESSVFGIHLLNRMNEPRDDWVLNDFWSQDQVI